MSTARSSAARARRLSKLNALAPAWGKVEHLGSVGLGPTLTVERFRLNNGLSVLLCEDHSAPVIAYHTWFRVGSRHEHDGKTGLAHLFEHLMFNETKQLKPGEFARRLKKAGAKFNAATWLDFTSYHVDVPKQKLGLVIRLEAERMTHLVLRDKQVMSERAVVANERRYRIDDDLQNSLTELLWATAFTRHPYRWPTIGWMRDIEGFTLEDCAEFYRTYYAPNNATLIAVGDFSETSILEQIVKAYGAREPSVLPIEDIEPEPPQVGERRVEVTKPTTNDKLLVGYTTPALGDFDHPAVRVLGEILTGGRASRLQQRLVHELELSSEVRLSLGISRDPGLTEIFASARDGHRAEELLAVIDEELSRLRREPVTAHEIKRAQASLELSLLSSLDTASGKAATIAYYDTMLGRPGYAFEGLEAIRRVEAADVRRVARRYFLPERRSAVLVRPQGADAPQEAAQ